MRIVRLGAFERAMWKVRQVWNDMMHRRFFSSRHL
jgi:hypothetical protein